MTAWNLAHSGKTTIDLNNQTTHFVQSEGANLGRNRTSWDEEPSYAGTSNVQTNVQTKNLVPVSIPMYVQGSSVSNLNTLLATLWDMVGACTGASPGTLTIGSETAMNIVYSTLPEDLERDYTFELVYRAYFTLVLIRQPS